MDFTKSHQQAQIGPEKLPVGVYTLKLAKAEVGQTKKGKPSYGLMFIDAENRVAWQNQLVPEESGSAQGTINAFWGLMERLEITPQMLNAGQEQALETAVGSFFVVEVVQRDDWLNGRVLRKADPSDAPAPEAPGQDNPNWEPF